MVWEQYTYIHICALVQCMSSAYVVCMGGIYKISSILHYFQPRALKPPGWKQVWHTGVINASNGKLLAFISAVPATMLVNKAK